jgi:hypothetical protein
VGDECPECLEFGRNKAVAGDALALANIARVEVGGLVGPFPDDGLEGVGVS